MDNPQGLLTTFWDQFIIKQPRRVTSIFPPSLYANCLPQKRSQKASGSVKVSASYEEAAAECRKRVANVVKQCDRTNEKFTDPDFDIESDFRRKKWNCLRNNLALSLDWLDEEEVKGRRPPDVEALRGALETLFKSGLVRENEDRLMIDAAALFVSLKAKNGKPPRQLPGAVHRLNDIYEDPRFVIDGFGSTDVQQGSNGDCWLLAAVSSICSVDGLIERVCVAKNEECGVYGFVFFRDGEWISTVIDDNLYLEYEDLDKFSNVYDETGEKETAYKSRRQTGSEALYFAKCADQNETWLPLLEKAYAKIHGDYAAISGGWSGEAVEDLTGGITTMTRLSTIRSKEILWQEISNEKKEFIFGVDSHSQVLRDPRYGSSRRGLPLDHAYSVLKAVEEEDENGERVRLVLIRNPWGLRDSGGIGEWHGPWSDGSKEWTAHWINKLQHKFGNDGIFWISYKDFLKHFEMLSRTRLFHGDDWHVAQIWTSIAISWVSAYLNTKFQFTVTEAGTFIMVLSQLDTRYFRGLQGAYDFTLHFILRNIDHAEEDVARAKAPAVGSSNRSVSAEIHLDPGTYEIIPKILADRDSTELPLDVIVRSAAEEFPAKLRQLGLNHDIAHAKVLGREENAQDLGVPRMVLQHVGVDPDSPEFSHAFYCDVCGGDFSPPDARVHCQVCEDYDLCQPCFEKNAVSKGHQTSHEVTKCGIFMETEKVKPVAENCAKNVEPEVEPCAVEGISFICGVCQKVLDGCTDHARCVECEDYYLCQPCFEGGKVSKDHDSSHKIQKSEDATLDEAATAEPEDGKESKDPDSSQEIQKSEDPTPDEAATLDKAATAKPAADGAEPAADGTVPEGVARKLPADALQEIQARYLKMLEDRQVAAQAKKLQDLGIQPPENPWNAVCVVGCRIYSKQADVKISLVKPKMSEASMLESGGK